MIEAVLPQKVLNLIDTLVIRLDTFYLAGGTALAQQLGHSISGDLVIEFETALISRAED